MALRLAVTVPRLTQVRVDADAGALVTVVVLQRETVIGTPAVLPSMKIVVSSRSLGGVQRWTRTKTIDPAAAYRSSCDEL